MTEDTIIHEVWKVPTMAMEYDLRSDPWANAGIHPNGSLLARCRTSDRAEEIKYLLEEDSPFELYETDDGEQTYKFVINERKFEEDK